MFQGKLIPLVEGKLAVAPKPLSLDFLKKQCITIIIDLNQDLAEKTAAEEAGLKYLKDPEMKIEDDYKPISLDNLRYAVETIDRLILEGNYVYLHCTAAYGRSPTIAVALPYISWDD